jgi:D-lactate dehydrogenase
MARTTTTIIANSKLTALLLKKLSKISCYIIRKPYDLLMKEAAFLSNDFLQALYQCVTTGHLLTDPADCWLYSYDNSRYRALPGAVVFARETQEVQKIVQCCYDYAIPLVVRGRGTGTPGGSVPIQGGVVLSLEQMDRVINIDPENRCITVQAGVLNQTVQNRAAEHGFFWVPDPSSAAYCTVGGNIGYNAAGPRAVKYGATREHVLGLEAVIGTGEIIHTGTYTTKGAVGYDLTRLLIGSEGTLAIVTQAILKLTPLPETKSTLRLFFRDIYTAALAVTRIMAQPYTPCALEFIDHAALGLIRHHGVFIPENIGAMLLIDIDGSITEINIAAQAVSAAANIDGCMDIIIAKDDQQARELWSARKALSPALRNLAPKRINEDVVVPVSKIPDLLSALEKISAEYHIPIVNFGHAGNGNIHVNLLIDPDNADHIKNADSCLNAVFSNVIALNGTLSGEHGIGIEKSAYIDRVIDPVTLGLMRNIKKQFDPKTILNPGKIFAA